MRRNNLPRAKELSDKLSQLQQVYTSVAGNGSIFIAVTYCGQREELMTHLHPEDVRACLKRLLLDQQSLVENNLKALGVEI